MTTGAHIASLGIDTSLILIGIGVGLQVRRGAAISVVRDRRLLARSFVSMNVIMPIAAILAATLFALQPAVEVALVTVAVSPLPIHFPGKVMKAAGEDEYAVSLLVTMALAAVVVVPASLWLIGAIADLPLRIAPLEVLRIVASDVLIPVAAGAFIRRRLPGIPNRLVRAITRLGTTILVAAAIPLVWSVLPSMIALLGNGSLVAIAAFAVLGLAIGDALGGPKISHRAVLAIATASRHPAVALAIARANFPEQTLAPAAVLLYVIVSAVALLIYSRRRSAPPSANIER